MFKAKDVNLPVFQSDVTVLLLSSVSGDPSQWPVGGPTDPQPDQVSVPVFQRAAGRHSESSEDHNSDASLHCSY